VRNVLYRPTSDEEERRRSLERYVRTHQAGADGVLNQLFDDLDSQEACEQGRLFPKDACSKADPRRLLIDLFGRGKDVRSADRPIFSSISLGDHYAFVEALTHDKSRRVD